MPTNDPNNTADAQSRSMDGLENPVRRMAILRIAPHVMRELLQLPDGAEVIDIRVPIDQRGNVEVKIDGAGWETTQGNVIQPTTGKFTKHFDANGVVVRTEIAWGFSNE